MDTLLMSPVMAGGAKCTVSEYNDSSAFDRLAPQWDRLIAQCPDNNPFLTRQWQKLWWQSCPQDYTLRIITVSREDGSLSGIAPLCEGDRELTLLGSSDLCDYLDCIVSRGEEARFYRLLLSHLVSSVEKPLKLTLGSLRQSSPTIAVLSSAARVQGYSPELQREDTAPCLELPGDFAKYLALLSKKDRHEMRRKRRRAEREQRVAFHTISDPDGVMDALPHFLFLFRSSAGAKNDFLTPERERFFQLVVEEFSRRGWLELFALSFGGTNVAYLLCFYYNHTRYLYNTAYDQSYASLSPGIVAMNYCLEDAVLRGINRFDFLRGDEAYKYRFGARDCQLYTLTVELCGGETLCTA